MSEQLEKVLKHHNIALSEESVDKLNEYIFILQHFSASINLVSKKEVNIIDKLLIPSLYALKFISTTNTYLIDIGSGGGFPAIPLLIAHGNLTGILIEASEKKSAFLRLVCTRLKLPCSVINKPFQYIDKRDIPSSNSTVATVRGLKPTLFLIQFLISANPSQIILYEPPHRQPIPQLHLERSVTISGVSIREYSTTQAG